MRQIKLLSGTEHIGEIQQLFCEYTQELINSEEEFRAYLELQNYESELDNLSIKYGAPEGRLYLITVDGKSAGCIALRKLENNFCELKRLYIRPLFRGLGLAESLVQRIIDDAKEIGYQAMFLDTLPSLDAAIRLYKKFGFYEVACYNNSPIKGTVFMRLDLTQNSIET